jgi:hypothetical protein
MMNKENPSQSKAGTIPAIFPQITSHMVWARTVEMAVSAGRNAFAVRRADFQQAKCELTGETDLARQEKCFMPVGTFPDWPARKSLDASLSESMPLRSNLLPPLSWRGFLVRFVPVCLALFSTAEDGGNE